jgi:oligopeptide/dipeptide ABC transporter ATP-binding protein
MTALLEIAQLRKLFPVGPKPIGKARPQALLHAVDDVTFTLGAGESVGLVGESGCGKSTLVRLVTRLLDASSGDIRFDGRDIGAMPAATFARSDARAAIQMVFQDPTDSLNPRYTAFDTIAEPLARLLAMTDRAAVRARVEEAATQCGLPLELLPRFPHQLSGGQKARVGIARAISVKPRLLILDEPTAALDVSVQAVILHLLADLREQLGMSYLFVSHDLNVVRLLCDRVIVMYLGKVVESGPVQAVFEHPLHPYTRALIGAIPSAVKGAPGEPAAKPRLEGEPRSPIDPEPTVCRFFGRCPRSGGRCDTQMPPLVEHAPGHAAACHHPEPR